MNLEKYDRLISSLEQKALENPKRYLQQVIFVTLLGFIVLGISLVFALLPIGLLGLLIMLTIATKGKALFILLKLGKLLILLLIPTWYMLKSSVKLLFTRFPQPMGTEIRRTDAPLLFSEIDQIHQKMQGPKIHHVLLTGDINAAIVQHPRLGLFGWEQNYLILGLPLLQVLNKDEALAVIAHEYGHLSGHHGRFGGFVYRFRNTWGQLQQMSESWHDWGSKLIAKLFRWYAPYFNAYTFVYARQNEYLADQHSVNLVGAEHAAKALMRCQIAAQFESKDFWPRINKIIIDQAQPIDNKSDFWSNIVNTQLDENKRIAYLEYASKVITNHDDTHPCLSDRLKAIGVLADESAAKKMVPPVQNAAQSLLGESLKPLSQQLDNEWKNNVAEQWQQRHAYLNERKQKLTEINAKAEPTEEDGWEKISITEDLDPDAELLPLVQNFLSQYPEHISARYRRGLLLLDKNDEQGIADLEHVMEKDEEAILACCEAAWRFYVDSDKDKAEHYRSRWITRTDYLNSLHAEYQNISPNDEISEHNLDNETLQKIAETIQNNGKYIKKVYLVRRKLKTNDKVNCYALCFEAKWLTLGDKSQKIIAQLSAQDYPIEAHIVNLKHPSFGKFRKSIKKLQLQPIYQA